MKQLIIGLLAAVCLSANANIIKPLPTIEATHVKGINLTLADKASVPPVRSYEQAPQDNTPTASLSESFEGPGDKSWLPDGWTRQTSSTSTDPEAHWFNFGAMVDVADPIDGKKFMAVMFDSEYKDEWIISPEVTVNAGQNLSFYWWTQPLYLFVIDRNHVNFDEAVFINQEVAATLQVLVQPQDGEWVKVFDLAEQYADRPFDSLVYLSYSQMQHATVDMSQFVGQQVKIGIRYVGTDGDSMFVDAVSMDLPKLKARYESPWYREFFAFSYDTDMKYSPTSVEYYPVNESVSWHNLSFGNPDETIYEWSYIDPATDEPTTADTRDLDITYVPKYTDGNYLYELPTLSAWCSGYSNASYQGRTPWLQAAGVPTIPTTGGAPLRTGIWSMDMNSDGLFAYTVDGADFGDPSIPVFGYSPASDEWWTNYVSPSGTRQARLDAYLNVLIVPESPMVVDGAIAYGIGAVDNNAEFKLEIYALRGDDMIPDDEPLVSATCRGSDFTRYDYSIRYKYLVMPFKFDNPVVLSGRDAEAYAVFVSGFRGPDVEWFAPLMAQRPNDLDICYAQYVCHITSGGEEFDNIYMTAYFQNDEGEDLFSTFAISLGAWYPWIESDVVDINLDGTATAILGSSYDSNQLTVTGKKGAPLPDWLTATLTGSGDNIELTLTGSPEANTNLVVEVSAPGVKQAFNVHAQVAGIDAIDIDDAQITATYTLSGMRIDRPTLPGLYLVRLSDGSIRKLRIP